MTSVLRDLVSDERAVCLVNVSLLYPSPVSRYGRRSRVTSHGCAKGTRGGNQLSRAEAVEDVGVEIRNRAGAHYGGEPRLEGGQRGALDEGHRLYKKRGCIGRGLLSSCAERTSVTCVMLEQTYANRGRRMEFNPRPFAIDPQ